MAITASNSLAGTDGVQPTLTTLGQSGDAPAALDNTLLEYDNLYTVHSYNTLRMTSNYARHDTGRLTFDLPASGPWSVRFWVRPEPLSDPYDNQEYRQLFTIGSSALAIRESLGRNIVTRLQPDDLAAANSAGSETGTATTFDQLMRFEITFDGVDQLECSVYAGDATTGARINTWTHTPDDDQFVLSGYRWRKYTTLQSGDTDASTGGLVTPYQEKLLVWDPNSLPEFGADGDYGGETITATQDFQTERGLLVDGVAGPETHSALDLVVALDSDPNDYPIPLWIAGLTITDTGAAIGPLDEIDTNVSATVSVDGAVVAEDTTVVAHGTVSVSGDVSVTSAVDVTADGTVSVDGDVTVFKATSSDPAEADVGVTGAVVYTTESFIPPPPPLPPQMRLAVYNTDGTLRGYFYHPQSWSASFVLNDVGGMTLNYSRLAPGADLFDEVPFDVSINLSNDGINYTEPPDARFISLRRSRDLLERPDMVSWTLSSYGWMLRKAKLIDNLTGGERTLTDQPGALLAFLHNEALARDAFTAMSKTFNTVDDSDGQPWASADVTMTFGAGTDLASILESFVSTDELDWQFQNRTWRVYNANTVLNQNISGSVVLRTLGIADEYREDLRFDDYARRIQGRTGTTSGTVTIDPVQFWGRWEDFITLPGDAVDQLSPALIARRAETQDPQTQYVRRANVLAGQPVPLLDYNPGDRVGVEEVVDGVGDVQTRRVRQIALEYGPERVMKVTETFDQRFLDRQVRLNQMFDRVVNRSSRILGTGAWRTIG